MIHTPTLVAVALIGAAMVLECDVGRHRVTWFRTLRAPVVSIGLIVPLAPAPSWWGAGLVVELMGIVLGILVGALAVRYLAVWSSDGRPWQRAGYAYATVVLGFAVVRCLFSVGAERWFPEWLGAQLTHFRIDGNAFGVALVYVSLAFTLTRTVVLAVRARRSRQVRTAGSRPAAPGACGTAVAGSAASAPTTSGA